VFAIVLGVGTSWGGGKRKGLSVVASGVVYSAVIQMKMQPRIASGGVGGKRDWMGKKRLDVVRKGGSAVEKLRKKRGAGRREMEVGMVG